MNTLRVGGVVTEITGGKLTMGVDVGREDRTAVAVALTLPDGSLKILDVVVFPPVIERAVQEMRRQHVSQEIIDRVIRLNPNPKEGEWLRGWHRQSDERWRLFWSSGAIRRRDFVRLYGKEKFAALPKDCLIKRGRRVYVSQRASRYL